MFFLIQKDEMERDRVQNAIILDLLHRYRFDHEYAFMSISDFYEDEEDLFGQNLHLKKAEEFDSRYKEAIPIGNVGFVRRFLQVFKGVELENAIEVPPVLRTDEFLKRRYSIVPVWDIPRSGSFFIKDATEQKVFSYKGDLERFLYDEVFEAKSSEYDTSFRLNYDHLYQVSEIVPILAEYRVYVLQRELNSISQFAGNPLIFPDTDLITRAVALLNKQPDSPRSYSLDIMVTPRGTAITEVHNFMSLGLYSVDWDDALLYAFKDGIDYIARYNTEQTEFSNFDTFQFR